MPLFSLTSNGTEPQDYSNSSSELLDNKNPDENLSSNDEVTFCDTTFDIEESKVTAKEITRDLNVPTFPRDASSRMKIFGK